MWKSLIATFVTLLMVEGEASASDGSESSRTTAETLGTKTSEVANVGLDKNNTRTTFENGKLLKEREIERKPFTIPGLEKLI